MADPFEALRAVDEPIAPDPTFAARLRDRLARALVLPKGVIVSNLLVERPAGTPPPRLADPAVGERAAVTAYLALSGAPDALAWYGEVFRARLRGEPIVMPDGRIGHAELDIGGARLMLSEEHPEIGVVAPDPGAGAAVTLHLSVADV
ncbi:MAG TPA: hypothetical protein VKW77_07425, partial [Acidimicrobiales bacterium]|nr:hypothetical protein [Acidimicrobiales bacterium]